MEQVQYELRPIGHVEAMPDGSAMIRVEERYRAGLAGLEGFSHLAVLWWCHLADEEELRDVVDAGRPYVGLEYDLGVFATRSPFRPNPIALTMVAVASVDAEAGTIATPYLDAEDGTPILDIKPYTPSIDRVEAPRVPAFCASWPKNVETSGDFDWAAAFSF